MTRTVAAVVVCGLWALAGCASEPADSHEAADGGSRHDASPASERRERPALCARERDDAVREVFCAETPPEVNGLRKLQELLDLRPEPESGVTISGAARFVTLQGHSTALSGHLVSPINPRMLVRGGTLIMAFQRGVQRLELIAGERDRPTLNFYLLRFEQACNRRDEGCGPGDLYTPRIESDWLSVRIEDDEDLKNTPADCRQCHQRGRDLPTLLMRELNNPWTHFFQPVPTEVLQDPPGPTLPGVRGHDLMLDYIKAKGDEPYGGFAVETLSPISPFLLEATVGPNQPLLFDAPGIEDERFPYDAERGYPTEAGPSPTWEAAYEAFKRGEQQALPYLEPRATDTEKQSALSDAYARFRSGEIGEEELPDLADIYPDDPQLRARIGLQTEPDASAEELLIQACGSCHNDVLDQDISRARFNIDLWGLDAAEIAVAIARIELSPTDPGVMPPPEARQLDPSARARLLEYLRDDPLSKEPDPRLERAAELGMLGGGAVDRAPIDAP